MDVVPDKVEAVRAGVLPIDEPGLAESLGRRGSGPPATATTDARAAVLGTDASVICVGTPSRASGEQDLRYVERVLDQVIQAVREKSSPHTIILRSSVVPGTHQSKILPGIRRAGDGFADRYVYYPEFLREGQALDDFTAPAINVFAAESPKGAGVLRDLFEAATSSLTQVAFEEAEMVKYASNAFHALKVAFANEIATISHASKIDSAAVMRMFSADHKLNISAAYLRPGFAFGGSCLPKDTRALVSLAEQQGLDIPLLRAILPSNDRQVVRLAANIESYAPRAVGIWGAAFKPHTDDIRESPILAVAEVLMKRMTQYQAPTAVIAYDTRRITDKVADRFGDRVTIARSPDDLVRQCDLLVLGTYAVTPELVDALRDKSIRILDLKYFEAPVAITSHPNYSVFD